MYVSGCVGNKVTWRRNLSTCSMRDWYVTMTCLPSHEPTNRPSCLYFAAAGLSNASIPYLLVSFLKWSLTFFRYILSRNRVFGRAFVGRNPKPPRESSKRTNCFFSQQHTSLTYTIKLKTSFQKVDQGYQIIPSTSGLRRGRLTLACSFAYAHNDRKCRQIEAVNRRVLPTGAL